MRSGPEPNWREHGVKITPGSQLDLNTPQTRGMTRAAAITHLSLIISSALLFAMTTMVVAAELDPLKPRVPPSLIAEARALKNPVLATPENIAKGKSIYEGKGTCANCHGASGKGDGSVAMGLDPSPRNFTNPKFHKYRTDGEMFWVIKNGISGTSMIAMIGSLITEEEAWYVVNYERSFEDK